MSTSPHVTFKFASSVVASSSTHSTLIIGGPFSIPKQRFYEPPESCGIRKGGPRSQVYCEVFKHVPHYVHCGRSFKGRWYTWEESDDSTF